MKKTSKQANDLVNKSADTFNDMVKSVSGKGGLVGKVSDTSTDFVKNVSKAGTNAVGKTADKAEKMIKGASKKIFGKKKND